MFEDRTVSNYRFGASINWEYHTFSETYLYDSVVTRGGTGRQIRIDNFVLGAPYKVKLEFTGSSFISTFGNSAPIIESYSSIGISGRPMISFYRAWLTKVTGIITNLIIK